MQDLTDPAKSVMTRHTPDSGTPERAALMGALSYGPTALTLNPQMLLGPAAVGAAYTRPAAALARHIIAGGAHQRMAMRRALEDATNELAPIAGGGLGALYDQP